MTEKGLRLFVALELPEDVRAVLEAWGRTVAELGGPAPRPVPAGSLHVTLCFLGQVAPDQAEAVARACEVVRGSPVGELRVSRGLWLPRRRPRALAVELEDPQARLSSL